MRSTIILALSLLPFSTFCMEVKPFIIKSIQLQDNKGHLHPIASQAALKSETIKQGILASMTKEECIIPFNASPNIIDDLILLIEGVHEKQHDQLQQYVMHKKSNDIAELCTYLNWLDLQDKNENGISHCLALALNQVYTRMMLKKDENIFVEKLDPDLQGLVGWEMMRQLKLDVALYDQHLKKCYTNRRQIIDCVKDRLCFFMEDTIIYFDRENQIIIKNSNGIQKSIPLHYKSLSVRFLRQSIIRSNDHFVFIFFACINDTLPYLLFLCDGEKVEEIQKARCNHYPLEGCVCFTDTLLCFIVKNEIFFYDIYTKEYLSIPFLDSFNFDHASSSIHSDGHGMIVIKTAKKEILVGKKDGNDFIFTRIDIQHFVREQVNILPNGRWDVKVRVDPISKKILLECIMKNEKSGIYLYDTNANTITFFKEESWHSHNYSSPYFMLRISDSSNKIISKNTKNSVIIAGTYFISADGRTALRKIENIYIADTNVYTDAHNAATDRYEILPIIDETMEEIASFFEKKPTLPILLLLITIMNNGSNKSIVSDKDRALLKTSLPSSLYTILNTKITSSLS